MPHSPAAIVVLTRGDTELGRWALGACDRSDLRTINQLARMQLAAGRVGCAIRVRDACAEIAGLIELIGLTETLLGRRLRQVGGEPEHLEEVGVEEVVVPDDPVA
jgi:hypothetical protein